MRPTCLNFRSPKESTPDFYNPLVTSNGKKLGFEDRRRSGSFTKGKRFEQYEIDAKRTSYELGPGCYELKDLQFTKPRRGVPVFQGFRGVKDVSGCMYIGQSLVCAEREETLKFSKKDKKKKRRCRPASAKPKKMGKDSYN